MIKKVVLSLLSLHLSSWSRRMCLMPAVVWCDSTTVRPGMWISGPTWVAWTSASPWCCVETWMWPTKRLISRTPRVTARTQASPPRNVRASPNFWRPDLPTVFRELYAEQANAYTFWTYMMNSRAKNVGWRLDYFLLSSALLPGLCDSKIRNTAMGSDHCPITLNLAV